MLLIDLDPIMRDLIMRFYLRCAMTRSCLLGIAMLATLLFQLATSSLGIGAEEPVSKLTIVVMDPLAAPLSCPCVEGYAQRKYEVLAEYLEEKLPCATNLIFAESLADALKKSAGKADLIIGKHSVVKADAKSAKVPVTEMARLTDKFGTTTQTGLIVVAANDAAQQVADLGGYRVIFGPEECDEKHRAALDLLSSAGVAIPEQKEMDEACSDGACKVLELSGKEKMAAVISSYAAPLLEGCGTIKKGDLRVVGETKPVPFVAVFVRDTLAKEQRDALQKTLLSLHERPDVCESLESLIGFVPPANELAKKK
jgi:ABC-type phosphate/phosphonate transport system substrate-binding protein